MDKIICTECGKAYSPKGIGTHIWRAHGEGKSFDPNKGYNDGTRSAWNKGLNKDNNESVKLYSNSLKGREPWMKGKSHTEESKKLMSESAKESFRQGNHSSWTTRKNRSYAEKYFETVLSDNAISDYEIEYPIKIDNTKSSYFLDFYFPSKKLNLEIDGSQHNYPDRIESDIKRDNYLKDKGITVFRIKWVSPSKNKDFLEIQFKEFLKVYAGMVFNG
jgi:very-short-patch-repair endonuclease